MSFENLSNYTPLGSGSFSFSSEIASLGSETGSVANGDTLLEALAKVNDRLPLSGGALTGNATWANASAYTSPQVRLTDYATGVSMDANTRVTLCSNGVGIASVKSGSGLILRSSEAIGFSSAEVNGSSDTGLKRLAAATIGPIADNTHDLGDGSNRFQDIYATNATIQTSDANLKTDVVDISLGLDFINRLRPVTYKFKDYDYDVTVTDPETGEQTTETRRKTYTRDHAGLIAQEVATALTESGVDPATFAAYVDTSVKTGTGYKALRYEEFISPLIKAVQELTARVAALESA